MEANDKWESMPSKPKLTIVFGLALLLVVSFITYVTVYAADGRGNVGKRPVTKIAKQLVS